MTFNFDTAADSARATSASSPLPRPAASSNVIIPELLAPAGDWECAKAAVENGADAIYFGLERFNARMRAQNFTEADLPKLLDFLHRRGVKGYVTFNTLVFENELPAAEQYLRAIISAGVDAAIVQDAGICRLIRSLSPDFPIHASTQMTITSAAGVRFAQNLGCQLVVLARECSIPEIRKIQNAQAPPSSSKPASPLPLEVFVHGALCVAYSGQCLTSESLGGRSANRGECAQACRMPYDLISDGQRVPLGDKRYLLSPQDLAGIDLLPDLIQAGVRSLKIEGRLKSPEYVANITRVYRSALDKIKDSSSPLSAPQPISAESRYDLEMGFSRGLSTGWFKGIDNQRLVHARFGKKRGVYLGQITAVHAQSQTVALKLEAPLKPGDGVVFDAGHPDQTEEGGRIYKVEPRGPQTILHFGSCDIHFQNVRAGDRLWKTSDPDLDRRLRLTYSGDSPRFKRPISIELHGGPDLPLILIARDELGHVAQVESAIPLAKALTHPLDQPRLTAQLGRLGDSPFFLESLRLHLEAPVILPVSELNRMRREMVEHLRQKRSAPPRWNLTASPAVPTPPRNPQVPAESPTRPPRPTAGSASSELIVLVRDLPQLESALHSGISALYCEFEDPKKYRDAVALVHCSADCSQSPRSIWVAPPRICKTGEEWILKQVRSSNADGYLIRNYDHLEFFADCPRRGDYSLNVANSLTASYFLQDFGLDRVTASYDLSALQLEALLQSMPPGSLEITIHQHMPMFHMEHCVFCAFLSSGSDYTNCGRPCDKHHVALQDRVGARHPLKADAGCRNTVFNAAAQTGAEYLHRFQTLGARHFRIEFLDESPAQVAQTIGQYRKLLRGEITGPQLWKELKLVSQLGVTRGQMGG